MIEKYMECGIVLIKFPIALRSKRQSDNDVAGNFGTLIGISDSN